MPHEKPTGDSIFLIALLQNKLKSKDFFWALRSQLATRKIMNDRRCANSASTLQVRVTSIFLYAVQIIIEVF